MAGSWYSPLLPLFIELLYFELLYFAVGQPIQKEGSHPP
jgi:hypothetical protein